MGLTKEFFELFGICKNYYTFFFSPSFYSIEDLWVYTVPDQNYFTSKNWLCKLIDIFKQQTP